jgi:hypothetical protein
MNDIDYQKMRKMMTRIEDLVTEETRLRAVKAEYQQMAAEYQRAQKLAEENERLKDDLHDLIELFRGEVLSYLNRQGMLADDGDAVDLRNLILPKIAILEDSLEPKL